MLNNILISREDRRVKSKDNRFIGIEGENLQEILVFNLDEEIEGQGIIEVQFMDKTKGFIELEKTERGYELPVKSSLLTQSGSIEMQLRIIQEGQEIFKSEITTFLINEAINATTTIPEDYPTWIDNLEALKLNLENAEKERVVAEKGRVDAEKARAETFNQMGQAVDNAIGSIVDLQKAYDKNAEDKIKDFDAHVVKQTENIDKHVEDKITEYDEHTEELTNRLDGIDEKDIDQDKLIESLQNQIIDLETENETLKNQFPLGQAEGENITLTDSSDMEFKEFVVGGNSWQETRSGKNKINLNKPTSLNEASIKLSEDVLTVSSTATNTTPYAGYLFEDLETGDIIRLNGIILDDVGRIVRQVYKDNSWISVETIVYTDGSSTASSSYTVPDGINSVRYLFYSSKTIPTADSSSRYKNIILTINDSDMTYEPYGAMPSPEFRSEIQNVNGSANITVCNENLAHEGWEEDFVKRINNVAYAKIETKDGRRCLNYVASAGYQEYDTKYMFKTNWKENTPYVIQFDINVTVKNTCNFRVTYTDGTSRLLDGVSVPVNQWTKCVVLTDANKTVNYIRATFQDGRTCIDLDTFMVCEGSVVPEKYIPHQSQQFTFPLSEGQRMYKDSYLADDGVHHKRGQVVFDGTENWHKSADDQQTENTNLFYLYVTGKKAETLDVISNMFPTRNVIGATNDFIGICGNPLYNLIYIRINQQLTLEEWKEYLAELYVNGTPVKIQYKCAEPIIEPYTEEQQKVYNKIKKAHSYKNVTHIFSTDEIKPINKVIYRKDWETLNQKQEDRILALENAVLGGN